MKIEDGVLIEIENNDIDSDGKCVIPYGVTTIGDYAFNESSVKSVVIPNSVTNIDDGAFASCFGLTEITIPYSIAKIGLFAFYNCDLLKTVHISDIASWCNIDFAPEDSNPLYYKPDLYLNRELIKELVIPDGVTTIKAFAFEWGSFEKVIISDSVTSIEKFAFYQCNSIKSITIPNSVKSIGEYAFDECESLSKIIFEGELAYLDKTVFEDSINLKEIYVCSENMKNFLESSIYLPDGYEIIVDETLNKNKNINLGSDYLSDDSIDSSCNEELKANTKKLKEKDDYIKGD